MKTQRNCSIAVNKLWLTSLLFPILHEANALIHEHKFLPVNKRDSILSCFSVYDILLQRKFIVIANFIKSVRSTKKRTLVHHFAIHFTHKKIILPFIPIRFFFHSFYFSLRHQIEKFIDNHVLYFPLHFCYEMLNENHKNLI